MISQRIHQLVSLAIVFVVMSSSTSAQEVLEFDLDNGMHVIINPVEEASDIGVETIYKVGFVHEPEGMVQAAHLLEHLVCYAPGAGFKRKEAMNWLNDVGMANAETMPDLTHYDYATPAKNLEKVLQIEAARLQQKSFDRDLLLAEAKRVYQETDFVENNPATGMLKHAFMSLSHAWKFDAEQTLVRGGLEEFDLDQLQQFYTNHYQPRNLTLIITGKTTADDARALVEKHFAKIPAGEKAETSINWENVAAKNTVGWDSKNSAVCVAWKPPTDAKQQLLLSVLGLKVLQLVKSNDEVNEKCTMVMTSNNSWKVGELPLFIYGMAKPGEDLDEIEQRLAKFMETAIAKSVKSAPQMAKAFGSNYEFQLRPTAWARAKQTAAYLNKNGRNETQSIQQVLLHDALTRGMARHFLGDDPAAAIETLKNATAGDFQDAVDQCMTDENRTVVHIVPNSKQVRRKSRSVLESNPR